MKGIAPILVLIVLLLVAGGTAVTYVYLDSLELTGDNYIINGTSVYVNDDNIYMSVTPHTLQGADPITVELVSKVYDGEADIILGFAAPVKPTAARYFQNKTTVVDRYYSCNGDYWYNYTTNPKHFYCWSTGYDPINDAVVDSLIFDHEFDTYNDDTAYWTETVYEPWLEVSNHFNHVAYDYEGMTDWYYTQFDVEQYEKYTLEVDVNVPYKSKGDNKYWVCVKPHSETIAQADANDHLYCLDPWWNTTWNYYTPYVVTENDGGTVDLTDFQTMIQVDTSAFTNYYCGGERWVNSTNDEIDFYRQIDCDDYTAGDTIRYWVEIPRIPDDSTETVYIYYGNLSVVDDESNGVNTFLFFDGFEGGMGNWTDASTGTSDWTASVVVANVSDTSGRANDPDTPTGAAKGYMNKAGVDWTVGFDIYSSDYADDNSWAAFDDTYADWGKATVLSKIDNNGYGYYDGAWKTCTPAAFTNGNWYHIENKINLTSDTYDVWINYQQNCTGLGFYGGNTEDGHDYVHFATANAEVQTFYVDDFYIRKLTGTEPTAVAGAEATAGVPPILTAASPTNTTYYVQDIYFNVTSDIDLSWCGYSLDGAANQTMSVLTTKHHYYFSELTAIGSHQLVYTCNTTLSQWNTTGVNFTVDNGIILVNSAQNSATRTIGDFYSTNISVGNHSSVIMGDVLIQFNSTNYTATAIDTFTQGAWSGNVYNYNVTLGAGDVGTHSIRQYAGSLNDSDNKTNSTQYLTLTVSKWSNNTVTLTAVPDWSVEYGETATVSCTADVGTPTIYKDGIPVANPYSAVLDAGTYAFNCTVPESAYYYQSEDTDTLTIGETSSGCTNSSTFIYTDTFSVSASVVKINMTDYVNTHIVRENLGDVESPTSNITIYTNFTDGEEFMVVNSTNVSSFVLNFGNYYINTPEANTTTTNTTITSPTPSSSAAYYTISTVRDEMDLDISLPPNITSARVTLYCTGGSQEFNVTDEYFAIPSFRKMEQIELTMRYSATELYFRDLLYDSNIEYRTFYMADAVQYQVTQYVFNLQDNTYDYSDPDGSIGQPELHINKLIGDSYVVITERPFDVENKAIIYLIAGQQYQISVTSADERFETTVGNIQADTVNLEKTIVLTNVTDLTVSDANISYALNYDNSTGTISFNWIDEGENTILTELYVYNYSGSNTSLIYYVNSSNTSHVTYAYIVPNLEQEYWVKVKVHHSIFGENTLELDEILGMIPDMLGYVVSSISEDQLKFICSIFLIILILGFSPVHAGDGAVVVSILGALLTYVGIYPADATIVTIAVVLAILNKIIDRKVVT